MPALRPHRRAIIPTTGFIEWRHKTNADKTQYLFRLPAEQVIYLAGIWDTFEEGGRQQERFSIVTTDANPYIQEIHDRMPVVLFKQEFAQWLYGDPNTLIDRCHVRLEKSLLVNETGQLQQLGFL